MRNFQDISFIRTQIYKVIFKSALVHLQESHIHGGITDVDETIEIPK